MRFIVGIIMRVGVRSFLVLLRHLGEEAALCWESTS